MKTNRLIPLLAGMSLLGAFPALSAETTTGSTGPTKAQRDKMAEIHQKMADCLRSDRNIDDCHNEMRKACDETMGSNGCPMMGQGRRGMRGPHSRRGGT